MLKPLKTYKIDPDDVIGVELLETNHTGPDYHVRYGLQVTAFGKLADAITEFNDCCKHWAKCEGVRFKLKDVVYYS